MKLALSSKKRGMVSSINSMKKLLMASRKFRNAFIIMQLLMLLSVTYSLSSKLETSSLESPTVRLGAGLPLRNISPILSQITLTTKRRSVKLRVALSGPSRKNPNPVQLRTTSVLGRPQFQLQQLQIQRTQTLTLIATNRCRPFVEASGGVGPPRGISVMDVNNSDIGVSSAPLRESSRQLHQPTTPRDQPANEINPVLNDKYFYDHVFSEWDSDNVHDVHLFFEHVRYFENDLSPSSGVKGSLAKNINFWHSIGASAFVIKTIKEGYLIPFLTPPPPMFCKNNKSAFNNENFVDEAISELVESGCVKQVPFKPFVVSPLSVAMNKSSKPRLILDLSILNKSIKKDKFKFEDWKIAVQYFSKNDYLYKFDLKSGYHHIDICPQQHTYLGFSWRKSFYVFTVLPFGLSSAPFIFSKCLREMVKYWRRNSIKIVLYLDDGYGMNSNLIDCQNDASFVKESLVSAGFLINEKKSVLSPVQELEWLGIIWNSVDFSLSIPDRRINDLLNSLQKGLSEFDRLSARQLAQIVGRVISMSPVIGNISRLMSRYSYMNIENRKSWDSILCMKFPQLVHEELVFWLENIKKVNLKKLDFYSKSNVVVYSDASNVACAAYTVEIESKIFHQMWTESESTKSSTWKEMRAIEQALLSYQKVFEGKTLKWFTDNQNCVKIVKSGSMKFELQELAKSIFSVCSQKCMSIDIQWIPRSLNTLADYASKMIDHEDWGVSTEFFNFIDGMWGPHTIDRFASHLNTKLPRYNSLFWNATAEAFDAFTQDWSNENNWLVPPIFSVLRVIRHMLSCNARGTLIVPKWTSAAFWPYIFKKNLECQDYITDVLEFTNTERIFVHGSNENSIFGSSRFSSPVLAIRIRV